MELCVINPLFYPYQGGTEKVLYEIYRRLAKRHNVTVLTGMQNDSSIPNMLKNDKKESKEKIDGMQIIRCKVKYTNIKGLPMPLMLIKGTGMQIEKTNPDICHLNNRYLYYFGTLNAIKKSSAKFVVTIHNALPKNINIPTDTIGSLYDIVWGRRLMHAADLITAVTKYTADVTVPKQEMYKTTVIPNGVDSDKFKKRSKQNKDVSRIRDLFGFEGRIILTTARLVPQKGQIYLIKAVAELINEGYDVNLAISGNGVLHKYLTQQIVRLGMQDRIKIMWLDKEEDLAYLYNAADVFVMPSLYEPSSLSLLEGMASEIPTVATKVGGMPEILRDCGSYVKPGDASDIARQIKRILNDYEAAERKAKLARKLVLKCHNWDSIAKIYEKQFEGLVEHHKISNVAPQRMNDKAYKEK